MSAMYEGLGTQKDVDRTLLRHVLSLGGAGMRPAFIAQLRADLHRLGESLKQDDEATLKQAVHELKGLSSTIGATALAALSSRFEDLRENMSPDARGAMALGLRIQIDRLDSVLQAEASAEAADE